MIKGFDNLMVTKPLIAVRVGVCFGIALVLAVSAFSMKPTSQLPPSSTMDPLSVEHRLTSLESKMDQAVEELLEMKFTRWAELLGLSGLLGEAGIRLVKRKGGE